MERYITSLLLLQVDQYFKQLPPTKAPRIRSLGEKYRTFQLYNQIPIQDVSSSNCLFLEPWFKPRFDLFVQERNTNNLDVGFVQPIPVDNTFVSTSLFSNAFSSNFFQLCKNCCKCGEVGHVAVFSSKFPNGTWFHPACFVCSVCKELLVDLIHCVKNNKLYCERHFAQTIRPRCESCDEVRAVKLFIPLSLEFGGLSEQVRTQNTLRPSTPISQTSSHELISKDDYLIPIAFFILDYHVHLSIIDYLLAFLLSVSDLLIMSDFSNTS